MDYESEYNVIVGLLGLGPDILLDLLSDMQLPQDVRKFLAVCKKIHKLQQHPRFAKIIQSIIQITPAFIIKEASQGISEKNKFIHQDMLNPCTIAFDPVVSEGIVRFEVVFENTGGL
ncbi:MAG: hypothetical protein EZS28_032573 [Streblomastix strix]|uniref:F-box domain-containing protein n=1 Tax=Streblomastix strix TaxID=222440 RepID=A0A5J4UN39_9EUKA|nr:MAG: hypothetical protein EZS28_032573 [Streblomastix strix]